MHQIEAFVNEMIGVLQVEYAIYGDINDFANYRPYLIGVE